MKKAGSLKESFRYALKGIGYCLRHERNFRIHCCVGGLAVLLGLIFDLSGAELCVLLLLIAFVLFAEMANTALEKLVDLCTEEYHPLAAAVKDIAAGAVLVICMIAVIIGAVLFIPHLVCLLN